MKIFLPKLAYLCDILVKPKALNLSLQSMEKMLALIKERKLWKRKMSEDEGKGCFPLLQQFLTSNGADFLKSTYHSL
jgi:sugar diacid utilization regulator